MFSYKQLMFHIEFILFSERNKTRRCRRKYCEIKRPDSKSITTLIISTGTDKTHYMATYNSSVR